MKKNHQLSIVVLTVFMLSVWLPVNVFASGGLVSLLTDQLGVTTDQAEGGAGAFFKAAKENMKAEDFTTMAQQVPEATSLLSKAPQVDDDKSALIKGAASMLGDTGTKVEAASDIVASFKKLGLDGDMVQKFSPIITDYVKEKAGDVSVNLLKSALSL